jgi:hypothetical protein
MIIDCFPFFAPYNEEILKLRVNLLKDHVDKFIIVESNKTHSGKHVERRFLEVAQEQGLPMEKIIYIEHDIPETDDLEITKLDRMNAGENANSLDSLHARVRERLQKDAIMDVMDQFNDNDIFIYGDADEIIKPQNIHFVANLTANNPTVIIKIPLVYLQGRADLRLVNKSDRNPVIWMNAMFFATKKQIMATSINRLRCGAMHWPVRYPTQNNVMSPDMGWHFAWMGDQNQRNIKASSFAHAFDNFDWMDADSDINTFEDYDNMEGKALEPGGTAPSGNPDHLLAIYPVTDLPEMIFKPGFEDVKDFLLPSVKLDQKFRFSVCNCFWCQKLQWPLLYNLDNKKMNWFEVPRCCSVSIKKAFTDRTPVYRDTDEYDDTRGYPLVVWTDPIERFVSLINAYLIEDQRYHAYGKQLFALFDRELDECTKQEKIDLFFEHLNLLGSAQQVHHFYPQAKFVDKDKFKKFTIVKKQDVNKKFGISKVFNVTRKDIVKEDFSPEQIKFIKDAYEEDYAFIKKYGKK